MLPFNIETLQVFELLRLKDFTTMAVRGELDEHNDLLYLELKCDFSPNYKDLIKDLKTGNVYSVEKVWWKTSTIVQIFLKLYALNAK